MTQWGCEGDRRQLAEALRLWDMSYRHGLDDAGSFEKIVSGVASAAIQAGDYAEHIVRGKGDESDKAWKHFGEGAQRYQAYARWAHDGYPVLEANASVAAAMMCTQTSGLVATDIQMPYRAVMATVPDGLLLDGELSIDRVMLDGVHMGRPEEGIRLWMWHSDYTKGALRAYTPPGTTEQALLALLSGAIGGSEDDPDRRIIQCAGKYIVGLLVALQYTDNFAWRDVKARPKKGPWSRSEPAHRVAMIGRAISADFSSAVRQYISGDRRGLPAVQSMVRGHYKRQVFGPDRRNRKVIWIEPYWRGPEDAPILARPVRVGPTDSPGGDK